MPVAFQPATTQREERAWYQLVASGVQRAATQIGQPAGSKVASGASAVHQPEQDISMKRAESLLGIHLCGEPARSKQVARSVPACCYPESGVCGETAGRQQVASGVLAICQPGGEPGGDKQRAWRGKQSASDVPADWQSERGASKSPAWVGIQQEANLGGEPAESQQVASGVPAVCQPERGVSRESTLAWSQQGANLSVGATLTGEPAGSHQVFSLSGESVGSQQGDGREPAGSRRRTTGLPA